jgi:hypothetical protein
MKEATLNEERTNDPQAETAETDKLQDLEISDDEGQSIKGGVPKQPDGGD